MRRYCHDCQNYPSPQPTLPRSPDPKRLKGESERVYQERLRVHQERNAFELDREPVCVAGFRMSFQLPTGHPQTDQSWGHYRPGCASFTPREGG